MDRNDVTNSNFMINLKKNLQDLKGADLSCPILQKYRSHGDGANLRFLSFVFRIKVTGGKP